MQYAVPAQNLSFGEEVLALGAPRSRAQSATVSRRSSESARLPAEAVHILFDQISGAHNCLHFRTVSYMALKILVP